MHALVYVNAYSNIDNVLILKLKACIRLPVNASFNARVWCMYMYDAGLLYKCVLYIAEAITSEEQYVL